MRNHHPLFIALALTTVAWLVANSAVHAATTDFDLDKGLRIRSDDKQWLLDLGARVHVDGARFDDDVTPLDDDVLSRRLRPTLTAKHGGWTLRADYDFGDYADGWKNLWLGYRFSKRFDVRVGNQTVPFGLEETASSDDNMFMERPLASQLAPGLLTGALARGHVGRMSWSLGAFANDLADDDRRSIDGESVAGRITFSPMCSRSAAKWRSRQVRYCCRRSTSRQTYPATRAVTPRSVAGTSAAAGPSWGGSALTHATQAVSARYGHVATGEPSSWWRATASSI
jgi:phosphate-selective porin